MKLHKIIHVGEVKIKEEKQAVDLLEKGKTKR